MEIIPPKKLKINFYYLEIFQFRDKKNAEQCERIFHNQRIKI